MVEKNNEINYKELEIDNLKNFSNSIKRMREGQEEVLLFFSFDIVNSSQYKTVNYYGWSSVLSNLFEKIRNIVKQKMPTVELWRVLGDEIIFIIAIKDEKEINIYIQIIYEILIQTVKDIKNGDIFKDSKFSERESNTMKLQNILSLKGSAWIAIVYKGNINHDNLDIQYENISTEYITSNNYHICEFLGNDIDTGFRVSKQTCDRRLVLSFELAYLLSKRTENISKLFIISYKRLKGIWNNKLYPIIWYYDKSSSNNINFEESFYYDEIEECELSKQYFKNINNDDSIMNKYMFNDIVKAFNKIMLDRNLSGKIKKIEEVINNKKSEEEKNSQFMKIPQLEFQCVAVCYDKKEEKILIARRKGDKDNFPNKWEFGSAVANLNEDLTSTIIRTYKKIFNIQIDLIKDEKRKGNQPIPIALYEISKENQEEKHKGIIVIATLVNKLGEFNKEDTTNNYSEIKWIKKDEAEQYEKEGAIPDFLLTVNKVFDKFTNNKDKKVN